MLFPATTVFEAATLVRVTSAEVAEPTTVATVAELFAKFGSLLPDVMLSVSTICVPKVVPAFTCTATTKLPVASPAKLGFVQVIVPVERINAAELQVHPVGAVMD